MRSTEEMLEWILSAARNDERVRAVYLNGSRANPKAREDLFQDFDVVYLVRDLASFRRDAKWIDIFGERIILQCPDDNRLFPSERPRSRYAYLMLLADGNRIDLTLCPVEEAAAACREDSQTVALLDKDGLIPPLPAPSDRQYHIVPPTRGEYEGCCNEFWWVSSYVAKGLWRGEHLYAYEHLGSCVRPMAIRMLTWEAGFRTGFSVTAGKCGKELKRLLSGDSYARLLKTYRCGSIEECWESLFLLGELFRESAVFVGKKAGFDYPFEDDRRVSEYLCCVRSLPPGAREFSQPVFVPRRDGVKDCPGSGQVLPGMPVPQSQSAGGSGKRQEKELNGQRREDIRIGALVDIVLKKDQPTGKLTRGHVKRILTGSATHVHGIKVMLEEGGQVGRVKRILEDNP